MTLTKDAELVARIDSLADQIATLYGWCPAPDPVTASPRQKALGMLWRQWVEAQGYVYGPTTHPILTDEHIAELARQWDQRPR